MQALEKNHRFRRTLDSLIRFTSSVGEETEFKGSFNGGENIVVRGLVQGESDIQGIVVVTDTGRWHGKLIADIVIVAGKVEGDIVAREKIEVHSMAKIVGNLHSPVIAIESGAVHDGHIDMTRVAELNHFEEKRESRKL